MGIKTKQQLRREYMVANPWMQNLMCARRRCSSKNQKGYKFYGGRGIRCLLTPEEIKTLYFRDSAHAMKRPSIDRINVNGHYEIGNCRFIEHSQNSAATRRSRTGCTICGPTAKHRGNGLCNSCWNRVSRDIKRGVKRDRCKDCGFILKPLVGVHDCNAHNGIASRPPAVPESK